MKIRIRNARLTYSLCAAVLCIMAATVVFAQSTPVAPSGTSLQPLWPFVPGRLTSYSSSQFVAGDIVCLDATNSTASTLYVVDNGNVRCAVSQPQVGIALITDASPATIHSVIIEPEVARTAVCPLNTCAAPMANLLPPCNAVRSMYCFK